MEAPIWLKPAILGGVVGAIATMVVGFNQGGWMLGSSAERMAQERSAAAVTEALVPVCIGQSKADPEVAVKLAQLRALSSSYEQRQFVEKSGWATMPAAGTPNSDLASACAEVLLKPTSTWTIGNVMVKSRFDNLFAKRPGEIPEWMAIRDADNKRKKENQAKLRAARLARDASEGAEQARAPRRRKPRDKE